MPITYADKEQGQASGYPSNQTWSAENANEVKSCINSLEGRLESLEELDPLENPVASLDYAPTSDGQQSYLEGRTFYDSERKTYVYMNDIPDVRINVGQEVMTPVFNNSGSTIGNGSVVRASGGVSLGLPEIVLALADTVEHADVFGVATHDIQDGTRGYITVIGNVGGVSTLNFEAGDKLYLSDTVAGSLTNVEPRIVSPVGIAIDKLLDGNLYVRPRGVQNRIAVGQIRGTSHDQEITNTPSPVEAFSSTGYAQNVTLTTAQPNTDGYTAEFSPAQAGDSGLYLFTFSTSVTSNDNNVYVFELYINGASTGIKASISLDQSRIDYGSATISGITEVVLTESDNVSVYVYRQNSSAEPSDLEFQSTLFSVEKLGVV